MLRSSHPQIVTRNQAVVPFAAEKIRVGRDYQAVCPELEPVDQRRPELISDRALLVWSPTCDISDIKCKFTCVKVGTVYNLLIYNNTITCFSG